MSFEKYHLHPNLCMSLSELGYKSLLPVQEACLEPIRAGRNVSVRSKTGTGKTLAFGIPLLEKLDKRSLASQILVLAPTRELVVQVAKELKSIGSHFPIEVLAVYGGVAISGQIKALRSGAQVIVGTPGRLMDLVGRNKLDLNQVQVVVLDEADEMLSMGFYEDVTHLMKTCKHCTQYVILSASLSQDTESLIEPYTSDVLRIDLSADTVSVEGIEHIYYHIRDELPKHHYLLHVLAAEQPETAIVFVNTRKDASLVATFLAREKYQVEMISGELPQKERQRVMNLIKNNKLHILVATDLAARGIDITHLSHVINFSLPEDPTVYQHRVGRTGRVGRSGTAISLVSGARLRNLDILARQFGIQFQERTFPSTQTMIDKRCEFLIEELIKEAEHSICDGYLTQASAVMTHPNGRQAVAYLLKKRAESIHDSQRTQSNRSQPKFKSKLSHHRKKKHAASFRRPREEKKT